MEREIVIVGAGPAGSTAAIDLAQRGHDVLLIDRKEFPRDKICGDAVPHGAVKLWHGYGMKDRIKAAEERGEFYRADGLRLVSPRQQEVSTGFIEDPDGVESYVAPRKYLDNVIYEHAVDSGAEFKKGQVQGVIQEDGVVKGLKVKFNGKTEAINAKVVIGADGVSSVVARNLRPDKHRKEHKAVALRCYAENFRELPRQIEFFLYKGILPGYAWVFPTGNGTANIGLGMRVDKFDDQNEKLEEMLDRFLGFPEMKERMGQDGKLTDIAKWPLNFGSQQIQRAYNGAVLIGDAGGYINPLTGGGIANAAITAQVAARHVSEGLRADDVSRNRFIKIEEESDAELWEGMQRSYRMQKWLMRFPLFIDGLVKVMGGNSKFTETFLEKM